jgi:RNA polymerase sigma factor (TIGR02999 family)
VIQSTDKTDRFAVSEAAFTIDRKIQQLSPKHGDMADITHILQRIESGEPLASSELLPLVYDQLRKLAARQLQREPSGLTLQPTALVNEAYVRLVDKPLEPNWNHRGHFFSAAATAMRRILVERARRKKSKKGGGEIERVPFDELVFGSTGSRHDLIALDEALSELERQKPELAKLVSLRFFAGLAMPDVARSLGMPLRTAERQWSYAKAWLLSELANDN